MAVSSRSRIDPFNYKIRERISSFGSISGSEHDAVSSSSSSTFSPSPRLSYLVHNFLENSGDPASSNDADESDNDSPTFDPTNLIRESISPSRFRTDLLAHVSTAAEMFSLVKDNPTLFNRNVMAYLRQIGFNAGVCKTKWEAGNRLIAGSHEFIDVLERNSRFVVDLNFAVQFEIARGTERYMRVIDALPRLFVGKSDDLKRIVRITAGELKQSMKISEMSLPPWRKSRYMMAKWFGPCHRTVNQLPNSGAGAGRGVGNISAVKCRSVGFCAAAVVAPPTTRTR